MAFGKHYGSDCYLALGKETTWATSVTRTKFLELSDEAVVFDPGRTVIPTLRSRLPVGFFDVAGKTGGPLNLPIVYQNIGMLLRTFFGGYTFTAGTGGPPTSPNSHVFIASTTKPKSLSVEIANSQATGDTAADLIAGAYGKKLGMEFTASGIAKMTAEILGIPVVKAAKTTLGTIASADKFVKPSQIVVTLDSDAGVALEMDQVSINFDTGLDDGRAKLRGSSAIVEPEPTGKASVTASFARDYYSDSMFLKLLSAATASLTVTCTGPAIGGSFTGNFSFKVEMPTLVVKKAAASHQNAGIVPENVELEVQDDGTGNGLKITILSDDLTF